jgi:hypothetical protein
MLARVEIKEPIEGICDTKNVYVMFSMLDKAQVDAVCSIPDSTIENRLNSEVEFIKDKPNYKDKGMVDVIINCKGEVVQCKTDNKSKSPILDEQILSVFKTLTTWKAAKLNDKDVDSMKIFSFEVKGGKIILH